MLPPRASAQQVDKIYVFGDSLSDVGNTYNATLQLTGQGYPPPPYVNGRFSNGSVWVEYLGQQLGLTPTSYTTIPPGNASVPDGINYAFGGSGSGLSNVILPQAPLPGVLAQVNLFTASVAANPQLVDPEALYIVWGGANDYLFGNVTDPQVPVNNLSAAVSNLAAAGAKTIMVANLPDLGKVPGTRGNSELSSQLSNLTSLHNSSLAQSLNALSQSLGPSANIILLDVNTLFNTVTKYPGAFGFTNVTNACLTSAGICANPSQYLFWDDYHPTTAGHKVVQKLASFVLKVKTRHVQVKVPQDFLALEAQDFNDKIDLSCNLGRSCSNSSSAHQPVTKESMVSDRFGGKITIVHLTPEMVAPQNTPAGTSHSRMPSTK